VEWHVFTSAVRCEPTWSGRFLPQSLPAEERLRAYEPLGERAVLWTQLPGSSGPSDVDALGRFHNDVRALLPDLDPLPEPEPIEPATLFRVMSRLDHRDGAPAGTAGQMTFLGTVRLIRYASTAAFTHGLTCSPG
jgi:hypothetical protein